MTHTSTEQERVDTTVFKRLLNDYVDCLRNGDFQDAGAALLAVVAEYQQAARRAPVAPVPRGMNAPNEWEDIRTLPTCDDLIWLYCQDSNTIDGPISPEPNLEEYGWTHWAYANAPSTAWIDAAQAKQRERP